MQGGQGGRLSLSRLHEEPTFCPRSPSHLSAPSLWVSIGPRASSSKAETTGRGHQDGARPGVTWFSYSRTPAVPQTLSVFPDEEQAPSGADTRPRLPPRWGATRLS